jgi:hypothetical protein
MNEFLIDSVTGNASKPYPKIRIATINYLCEDHRDDQPFTIFHNHGASCWHSNPFDGFPLFMSLDD